MSQLTDTAFQAATAWIEMVQRPLIVSHANPDGDALGSLVALRSLLSQQGKLATALVFEPLPASYAWYERTGFMAVLSNEADHSPLDSCDGVIVVDTCSYSQLEPIAPWLKSCGKPILAIDHHVNRDELADTYLIDDTAAAASLIIYQWAQAAGWTPDANARDAMFVGIATDTGWFRFSNADARVFETAAALARAGSASHALHQQLYLRERPARIRLLGAAVSSLELMADGRLALMTLDMSDFEKCGAESSDTENIVNEPLRIESVSVSAILVDRGHGPIKCSFRSKPPLSADQPDVDVSAIAKSLGGGGHRRAAAARVSGSLPEVRTRVIAILENELPASR